MSNPYAELAQMAAAVTEASLDAAKHSDARCSMKKVEHLVGICHCRRWSM